MSRNMARHQRRRHSDPYPNTSTCLARTVSPGPTIDQLAMDVSRLNISATIQGHGRAQPVNASTITSATGTTSGDITASTPTRHIIPTADTSTTTISTRNETDIPEWWPNNIPPFYIIVRDVGLGLRGEAFYWLVHGYHVSDHQWRQLTVQALEDEVDPQRRMDPVMLRRILWSSMPGNFWMHATGATTQPGMDPTRTGEYHPQGSSGGRSDAAAFATPPASDCQPSQGCTGPIVASPLLAALPPPPPPPTPAMPAPPTSTAASDLPLREWPRLPRRHPVPSPPAMSTWSGVAVSPFDCESGEFWIES